MSKFYGKYRGKVLQNNDPEQRGRILVSVAYVMGAAGQNWAMPCVPFAGIQSGVYVVPPIGANVWVEFEGGDPERPIWVGGFWGLGETPPLALAPPQPVSHILLQTTLQNSIHISDAPGPAGGIIITSRSGAMIMVNDVGITIQDGKGGIITMTSGTVSINPPNLVVIR